MDGSATHFWKPARLIHIRFHVDICLPFVKYRSCGLTLHRKIANLSMPVNRLFRLVRSYQFGWFLGVVVEFLVRAGLGEDCGNGFEDAVCDGRANNHP